MAHSALTGSMPTEQTAWVVLGSSGQWSDWSQWPVAVYLDEAEAKGFVERQEAAIREVLAQEPSDPYDANDDYTPAYSAWLDRLRAVDGNADQYEQPHYTARAVPLRTTPTPSQAQDGYGAARSEAECEKEPPR